MKILVAQFKALGEENRLRIVLALLRHPELCACQLTEWLGVSGATASRHVHQLVDAGLVACRKEGRWVYFSLSEQFPPALREGLQAADIAAELQRLDDILSLSPTELCRREKPLVSYTT